MDDLNKDHPLLSKVSQEQRKNLKLEDLTGKVKTPFFYKQEDIHRFYSFKLDIFFNENGLHLEDYVIGFRDIFPDGILSFDLLLSKQTLLTGMNHNNMGYMAQIKKYPGDDTKQAHIEFMIYCVRPITDPTLIQTLSEEILKDTSYFLGKRQCQKEQDYLLKKSGGNKEEIVEDKKRMLTEAKGLERYPLQNYYVVINDIIHYNYNDLEISVQYKGNNQKFLNEFTDNIMHDFGLDDLTYFKGKPIELVLEHNAEQYNCKIAQKEGDKSNQLLIKLSSNKPIYDPSLISKIVGLLPNNSKCTYDLASGVSAVDRSKRETLPYFNPLLVNLN